MRIDELVEEVETAKAKVAEAERERDEKISELTDLMVKSHIKTASTTDSQGRAYRVTVVTRETVRWNEDAMLKAFGKRRFSKIASLKLDRKVLEQKIVSGEINPDEVEEFATVTASAPFVRITDQGDSDE